MNLFNFPKRGITSYFLFLLTFFSSNINAVSQCEGTYLKPAANKVFTERVYIRDAEDITGDAALDLIGYGFEPDSTTITKLYLYPGNADLTFESPITLNLPTPIGSGGEQIIDFNFDGKKDILINSNPIFIFLNEGNGNFNPLPATALELGELFINAADINNDNIADLLTLTNILGQGVTPYYRLGNANGTFNSKVELPFAIYSVAADFNNDGKIDFPTISGPSNNRTLRIYYNQGNGVLLLGSNSINIGSGNLIRANDFNNDGKADLSVSGVGSLAVLMNTGNDSFTKTEYQLPVINSNSASYPYPSIGEFNSDGFLDFLVTSFNPPFYVILTNNGNGNFTSRRYDKYLSGGPVGDFDNDGKTDFLSVNPFNFINSSYNVRIFNETQISIKKNVCSTFGQTKIVDFNGDGLTDRVFWRESEGRWRYKLDVFPHSEVIFNWGISGDIPVLGDYDGDGKTDFAVYRPSNGVWYILNSSDGSFSFAQFGISEDKPAASDFDGDGKTDIAVYRPSNGVWYIFKSSDQQVQITHFGISEDKPVPEDYDGDGKTDIAVFRPSTGVWYVLRSSDGNFSAIAWGVASDRPTPADYDGDGKADLAVYRPLEGIWYILRSNNFQYIAYRFGSSEDIPQVGDWNGNGIMDLGVYRPGSGNWYSSHSSSQVTYQADGEIPLSSIIKNQ